MQLKKVLKGLGLAVICGVLSVFAAGCSDDDPAGRNIGTGTVTGIVTDEQQGGVPGVEVFMPDTDISTVTSEDGKYRLAGVPMTSGIITFAKNGFQTASVTVVASKFDAEGMATVNVELVYANASITGFVYDANAGGAPMEGATVSVSGSKKVTTGADGSFTITGLGLRDYELTVSKAGYTSVIRKISAADFVDDVVNVNITLGNPEILRGLTKDDLAKAEKWYYNEYRGGRNAENYPHWDWACNYMCTLDFRGDWEEQNEGTTLRIRNTADDQRNNHADMEMFDSFVFGSKLITADNSLMTIEIRTHSTSDDAPVYYGVQVVDLSENAPVAKLIGGVRTLSSEAYVPVQIDLAGYEGKEVVIAIGTFRQQDGDYWKQLVIRRIAFTAQPIPALWAWLPGTQVPGLEGWQMTMEMVRSTMPHTKNVFTGISPVSGNRDQYVDAYRRWRDVSHIASEWSFMPLTKDPEVFPGEGYLIKTRGGNSVSTKVPESYFYAKYAIAPGCDRMTLTTRNFSSSNATYFKITAIEENGTVTHLAPVSNTASMAEAAADGCWKFIHESGDSGNPEGYAQFVYDFSQFDGRNVLITIGVFKGESNGDENKLVIYKLTME